MSLKHAMLGFLERKPLSGYDLAKLFDSSINFYWPATHSQIYRTLRQLLEEGLVRRKLIEQQDRPSKKVYSITKAGKSELRQWVSAPLDLPALRHGLLVQLAFAENLELKEILGLLQAHIEKLQAKLNAYQSDPKDGQLAAARSRKERFLWGLILWNGILSYECELKWAEEAIRSLKKQDWEPAER